MEVQAHDLSGLIVGTPEFSISAGAATLAAAITAGFRDIGNLNSVTVGNSQEQIEHKGSYRGRRIVDKKFNTSIDLTYTLKFDEMTKENLKFLFFGKAAADFTQTVISSAAAADALPASCLAGIWYDIRKTNVRVRNLLTCTVASLVENTDFVVDYRLGRIRFIATQATPAAPQITASAIVAGQLTVMDVLQTAKVEGYARLFVFDQNSGNELVFSHEDFKCEVTLNNQPEINGDNVLEGELQVKVLQPAGQVFNPTSQRT